MHSLTRTATIRSACLAAAGLCLGSVPACTAPSPYSPGRERTLAERKTDFPIDHGAFSKIGYRLDWEGFPAVTGSLPIQFFQAYADGVVTLEQGSTVTVLEQATGGRRCADQLANPLTKFVGFARDGNRLYIASESEIFTLDTQTCNMIGRSRTARNVSTEPVMVGNLLVFGSGAGELLAHLAGGIGGVKVWGFLASGAFEHKPVLIGDIVGAVSQSGQVVFLDALRGSLLSQSRIYGGLDTDPVSDGHLMYVASLDQSVYAFAPDSASAIWRYRTPSPLRIQPTVFGDRLYCAVPGQGLIAFESGTGKIAWTCKGFLGTIVAINNNRLVGWDGNEAALIDPQRGDIIDHAPIKGVRMLRPDKFQDGSLYAVSTSGVVARFTSTSRVRTGAGTP